MAATLTNLDDIVESITALTTMIDQRFTKVEHRLDRIEARLDEVEEKLNRVELRLDSLEIRVGKLEDAQRETSERLGKVEAETLTLRKEVLELYRSNSW